MRFTQPVSDGLLVDLSRLQFALTTLFHYLFVPLTLGLGPWVAIFETLRYRTGDERYARLSRFFGSLLLINFAIGVASGIIQEFQFGMNWAVFSRFVGDIFGAPLAMEGLFAFFLESTFLGLWIFGRDRLPRLLHLSTIWLFVIGTWLSAYFILAANSFMQNPVGYELDPISGDAVLTGLGEVFFQPLTIWAWLHTIVGGVIAATVFVFGVSAYHLKRGQHLDLMRKTFRAAIVTGIVAGGIQLFVGDVLGVIMVDKQPMKMAAAEAVWETTGPCASLGIVAIPDTAARDNSFEVGIPCLLSIVATNSLSGEVVGMNELQAQYEEQYGPGDYAPNVWVAFYGFRAMIGFGLLGSAWMVLAWWFTRRGRMPTSRWFWGISIWMIAAPWLGNLFGWIFTENGRQPWVVYGLLKTEDAVSDLSVGLVATSLAGFVALYTIIGVVEFRLIRRYAIRGPMEPSDPMPGEPPPVVSSSAGKGWTS